MCPLDPTLGSWQGLTRERPIKLLTEPDPTACRPALSTVSTYFVSKVPLCDFLVGRTSRAVLPLIQRVVARIMRVDTLETCRVGRSPCLQLAPVPALPVLPEIVERGWVAGKAWGVVRCADNIRA